MMLRAVVVLCSANALLAPVTPSQRCVARRGFFDDMMDKFVVSDNDESKQQQAEAPPPEKDDRDVAEKLFGFFFGEV